MNRTHFVLGILLTAMMLTLATFAVLPSTTAGNPQTLTVEQMRLVAEKERAREAAGVPPPPAHDEFNAQADAPVEQFTGTIQTSKSELLADWERAWQLDQAYLSELEQHMPEAAQQKRDEMLRERQQIESLPEGPIEVDIPSVKAGQHSIHYSKQTYDSGNGEVDPINFVWYGVGSAYDVWYDLENWTNPRWQATNCGSYQKVYIWDSVHTGGWDGYRDVSHHMEPENSSYCGTARFHARLFQGFVPDSHGGFGEWTISALHHDNTGHRCSDDFEDSQGYMKQAFINQSNGQPEWFVGSIWESYLGNYGEYPGGCDGVQSDGWATYVELIY